MTDTITITAPVWEGERGPLIKALVAAQLTSEAVLKAATNPAFRSRYADLAAVVEAVVPALNRAGVAVIQVPSNDGDLVTVTTILAHESGATLTGSLGMRPTKADPQGVGSAVTYARRYALLAMTGAAPEDDDGNHASRAVSEPSPSKVVNPATGRMVNPMSANQARKDGRGERFNALIHEISDLTEVTGCLAWGEDKAPEIHKMPDAWQKDLREKLALRISDLRAAAGTVQPYGAKFDVRGNPIEPEADEEAEIMFPAAGDNRVSRNQVGMAAE